MAQPSLLAQAQQCLAVMHGASGTVSPADFKAADNWLQHMMQLPEAWGIANDFLNTPSSAAGADVLSQQRVFFGASIFATKLRQHFDQLPAASLPGLQTTLQGNLQRLAGAPPYRAALMQLCVALIDLLLQQALHAPDGRATIEQLVQAFPPATHAALLTQLLRLLAEQAQSLPALAVGDRRAALRSSLQGCGPALLGLLHSLFTQGSSAGGAAGLAVCTGALEALGAWCAYPALPAAAVAASPAIGMAVEAALASPQLLLPAAAALEELLKAHYRTHAIDPAARELGARLTEGLVRLAPVWGRYATGQEDTEEEAIALANLFSTAVYTFLPQRLKECPGQGAWEGAGGAWEAEVVSWTGLLALPGAQPLRSVLEPTFWVWRKLAEELGALQSAGGDGGGRAGSEAPHRLAAVRRALARPLLAQVPAWLSHLTFPPAAEWGGEMNREEREAFKHEYRYDCSDALLLIASVAGGEAVVGALAGQLQSALAGWNASLSAGAAAAGGSGGSAVAAGGSGSSSGSAGGAGSGSGSSGDGWQQVEAALYALRAVARLVPEGESTVLPQLFMLLLGGSLPLRATSGELLATVFRIVGRYCEWLSHPARGGVPGTLNQYQAAAWTFLLREGLLLSDGPGVDAPAGGSSSAPPPTPRLPQTLLASPATESACIAVSRFSSVCGSYDLDASLLALPHRLHVPGLARASAVAILESWGGAVLRSGIGKGGPEEAVAAALAPVCQRLEALCGGSSSSSSSGSGSASSASEAGAGNISSGGGPPNAFAQLAAQVVAGSGGSMAQGALALCACDGTLAASLAAANGEIQGLHARAVGLGDSAAAARLWAAACAGGGNVGPSALPLGPGGPGSSSCLQPPSPALDAGMRAAVASPRAGFSCARSLLHKLRIALAALSAPPAYNLGAITASSVSANGGGESRTTLQGGAGDWSPWAPPGFLPAWMAADKGQKGPGGQLHPHYAEACAGYEGACRAAVVGLMRGAWGGVEAALSTWGAGAPATGPCDLDTCMEVVECVGDLLQGALGAAGAAMHAHAVRFTGYLCAAIAAPSVGPHAVLLRCAKNLQWHLRRCPPGAPGSDTAALSAGVRAATLAALRAAVLRTRGGCGRVLAAAAASSGPGGGGRLQVEEGELLLECLHLAAATLVCSPGCLLEEAPALEEGGGGGGGAPATTFAGALLQLANAALASAHPDLCAAACTLLHELSEAQLLVDTPAQAAARGAAVNAALAPSYQDLVRRLVYCCTQEHLRDILNIHQPSLTDGLYRCLLLAPQHFLPCMQAALQPPSSLLTPLAAGRLTPAALQSALERLQAVVGGLAGKTPTRSAPFSFDAVLHALHVAAVRGDCRLLLHGGAEPEEDNPEDYFDYAFDDQVQPYYDQRDVPYDPNGGV